MKQFVEFMLKENFKEAAILVYDAILDVTIPSNVNLDIDRNKQIVDISGQLKKFHEDTVKNDAHLNFEQMWNALFEREEYSERTHLKTNEQTIKKAQAGFNEVLVRKHSSQYENLFETVTNIHKGALQSTLDAAARLDH
jgi:hypothetical protein